ncbi:hypothetical protein GCM10023323_22610 [Streptomyces thinghirensis]|uniref:Uncharacterized protein n=1 Tax=Streptomyces thinghirensis TaxID=551547 RepID=A0ABP9T2M9_9ACTN
MVPEGIGPFLAGDGPGQKLLGRGFDRRLSGITGTHGHGPPGEEGAFPVLCDEWCRVPSLAPGGVHPLAFVLLALLPYTPGSQCVGPVRTASALLVAAWFVRSVRG